MDSSLKTFALLGVSCFILGYSFRVFIEKLFLKKGTSIELALREISAFAVIAGFSVSLLVSTFDPTYIMPWQLMPLMGYTLALVWHKNPMTLVKGLLPFQTERATIEVESEKVDKTSE